MRISDIETLFNENTVFKTNILVQSAGVEGAKNRLSIINKYTGTVEIDHFLVGIKPYSYVSDNMFRLDFRVVPLITESNGNLSSLTVDIPQSHKDTVDLVSRICYDIVQGNMDVETTLSEYNFKFYYGEELRT